MSARIICKKQNLCLLASMDTMEKETQKEHTGDGISISAMMTITAAVTMIHYEARESKSIMTALTVMN